MLVLWAEVLLSCSRLSSVKVGADTPPRRHLATWLTKRFPKMVAWVTVHELSSLIRLMVRRGDLLWRIVARTLTVAV